MRSKKTSIAVIIALVVFTLFFIITFFLQRIEIDSLNREYDQLSAKYEKLLEYNNKLQSKYDSDYDEEYIRGVAKDKLNLVLPDEIIFYNDIAG